ncbi:MAG: hypothetical protein JSR17_02470 [Proteobacteria bacterium]|nr:hypothetical protein [Pseudomonadota bacterium]
MLNLDKEEKESKGTAEKSAAIQEIIVTDPSFGEYPGQLPIKQSLRASSEMSKDQEEKLGVFIVKLMKTASLAHEKNQHDENCITRLTTNEFSLYTEKPLKIEEFKALQEKIAFFASKLPENVHLVLSSFAVMTEDKKHLMNIVCYVECGKDPKMHLIVKNHSSMADPSYSIMVQQKKRELYNAIIEDRQDQDYEWDKHAMIREDQLPKFKIAGKDVDCSFNNVFICRTKGGVEFISCVDICLDHHKGVAKKNLDRLIDSSEMKTEILPTKCTHLVTSSTIRKKDENRVGQITHVDPKQSPDHQCKEGCTKEELVLRKSVEKALMSDTPDEPRFGHGEITVRMTPPMAVQDLAPQLLEKVKVHNREVKSVHPKQKQLKGLDAYEVPKEKIKTEKKGPDMLKKLNTMTMPGTEDYRLAERELKTSTESMLSLPQAPMMSHQYSNHQKQNGSLKERAKDSGVSQEFSSENPLNISRKSTIGK